jgi:hypothetical protein
VRIGTPAVEAGLAGLLLLLTATGCAKGPAAEDAGPAAAADERLRNAIGSYVEGYNLLGESVNALLARYAAAVPAEGAEPGAVRLEPTHLEVAERLKRARAEFDVGKRDGGAALAELGPLADRLRTTARKVMKTYAGAEHYYSTGGFKDDAGAGAATYHEEMRAREADFHRALSDLAEALDRVEDRQAQAEIDALAAGRGPGYWFRRANQAAKRMMGAVRALPDPRSFEAERAALQALAGELGAFVQQRAQALPGAFATYREALSRVLTAAGQLGAAVQPVDGGPPPAETTWGPAKQELFRAYNQLITAGNALYDLEEQGQPE